MPYRNHELPKRQAQFYAHTLGLEPVVRSHYGESAPDGLSSLFVAEYKSRDTIPKLLSNARSQVLRHAPAHPSKIPLVILHQVGQPHHADLAVVSVRDLAKLIGFVERSP